MAYEYQTSENALGSPHPFEGYQSAPQPNPYIDQAINGTAFFQSAAFQQPVRIS